MEGYTQHTNYGTGTPPRRPRCVRRRAAKHALLLVQGSFMIRLRHVWNWLADLQGLVKKSARLSCVRTYGTSLDFKRLDHIADEEVTTLHMLHAIMVLRVI